ncbi:MAG TPA: hypothetical protein VGQ83_39280 [Polyangia bacterium]|jgi:hypothetical protein
MRPRHLRVVLLVLPLLALGLPASGAKDPLLKYHPAAGDLPDLTVVDGSHQHGAGEGLTQIYDGGYERYTRAGVKQASQRYYKLGGRTVEIVIHEMKSAPGALKFFESFCKDTQAAAEPLKLGRKAGKVCAAGAEGSAFGYLVTGSWFVASSVDKADPKAARALLTVTGERLAGVKAPKKK